MLLTSLLSSGNWLPYFKPIARYFNDNDAAILLSELANQHEYYQERGMLDTEGYFFCDIDKLEAAVCMTKYKQLQASALLEKEGLIETKVKGLPKKRHYRFTQSFDKRLSKILTNVGQKNQPTIVKNFDQPILNNNKVKRTKKREIVNSRELTLVGESDSFLNLEEKKCKIPPPPLSAEPTPTPAEITQSSSVPNQGETSERVSPTDQVIDEFHGKVEIVSQRNKKSQLDFSMFDKPTDAFEIWSEWLKYRKAQKTKSFAPGYEQAALSHLAKISENQVALARLIVEKSVANSYRGLFELSDAEIKKHLAAPIKTATDPDGLVFDCDLNGQADSFRSWWQRTKEAYPNIAAEIRFFSASEFKRFTAAVPDWFPMLRQRFGSQRYGSMIQTAFQELECDPKRKFSAQGGLFAYLTNYFIQQA